MTADPISTTFRRFARELTALHDAGADGETHLRDAAVQAFANVPEVLQVRPVATLRWALKHDLPHQSWDNDFGSPAITVARTEEFRVDLLYWAHSATPTHSHVSCGAFAALHGDRLHTTYGWTASDTADRHVHAGTLTRSEPELMRTGDVAGIRPDLIHELFWLKRPSVTVSVRCEKHPGEARQPWEYHRPGLAVVDAVHHDDSLTSRRLGALTLLRQASPGQYAQARDEAIEHGEPSLAYHCVADYLAVPRSGTDVDRLGTVCARRGDAAGPALAEAAEGLWRKNVLYRIPGENETQRLLLGLLWAGYGLEDVLPHAEKLLAATGGTVDLQRELDAITAQEGLSTVLAR
jgi:hypothetical protein